MKPADRYSTETRTLLDLVAYELRRLGLPPGSEVLVRAAAPELLSDLADRLGDHPGGLTLKTHLSGPPLVGVYLLSVEEGAPGPAADRPQHALLAFRNRLSHKTLLYRGLRGLWYPGTERAFQQGYRVTGRWGLMAPQRVGWLLASALANRLGRHDLGFFLADRALLAPTERGGARYLSSVGLLVGSRP